MTQRYDYAGHWLETYCASYLNIVLLQVVAAEHEKIVQTLEEERDDLRQTRTLMAVCVNKLGNRVVIGERDVARIRGYGLHLQVDQQRKKAIVTMEPACEHDA